MKLIPFISVLSFSCAASLCALGQAVSVESVPVTLTESAADKPLSVTVPKPVRPEVPKNQPPAHVKELVQKFQQQRENYLEQARERVRMDVKDKIKPELSAVKQQAAEQLKDAKAQLQSQKEAAKEAAKDHKGRP